MDTEKWQRDEAKKAAESKLSEAERLVEAAEIILRSIGLDGRALDAKEAIEYIHGALGG